MLSPRKTSLPHFYHDNLCVGNSGMGDEYKAERPAADTGEDHFFAKRE